MLLVIFTGSGTQLSVITPATKSNVITQRYRTINASKFKHTPHTQYTALAISLKVHYHLNAKCRLELT